jgi:hypothetical protein
MPLPADHAARRRDDRLAQARRLTLCVASGAAAASLALGAAFAHELPGHRASTTAAQPPGAPPQRTQPTGTQPTSPPPTTSQPTSTPASPLQPPQQPPATTAAPPQSTSGGS